MAKILIGNIKGPQGEQGPQGDQGPVGPQGPKGDTGPMPTLINNGTTTQAGVGALDAAYGKTLTDKDTDLQNQLNTLNGKTESTFTIDPSSGVISRGTQKVRKTSHAMSVTMTFSVSGQISEPITIATLPEGFRPSRSISKFIALGSATSVFNITVAGKILIGYMSAPVDEGSYLVVDETILI